ncbi:MAG: 4-alpha-glucanotransferase [Elusimicrobiaceae bacterium]|nr:4-alpha-glucanotransferase [Elusimicrobiaceae bacterium]
MSIHEELLSKRTNGILLPVSAMKTDTDWGVGDFSSLCEWVQFLGSLGTKIVQILPLQETAPGQNCPYSALSAFAIDPIYIDVSAVREVQLSPRARKTVQDMQGEIVAWRMSHKTLFKVIKEAKLNVLWLAYQFFLENDFSRSTPQAQAFEAYCSANSSWLRNYSIFRALKEFYHWKTWKDWPEGLRDFQERAVSEFELKYSEYVCFFAYVQWQADLQLRAAKACAKEAGVYLFGDIPFGTNLDSAEVWGARENFRLDLSVGAPPDQFSEKGQSWGLPAYNWEYMQAHDFDLWRAKIRRAVELYDIFRLDHLVGFFRTYVFEQGSEQGAFDITDEQAQIDRGYKFLRMVLDSARGALPVGEDLGVIPDFVRRMLVDLKIPGYKVIRWEREDNGYYREPRNYPVVSLATTSTHDTDTLREWWQTQPQWERANIWEMISAQKTNGNVPFNLDTQRAILSRVLTSASAITMFSWQDIIGTLDRINTPGTMGDENWTYRSAYAPQEAAAVYGPQLEMYKELLKETGRAV